LSSRRPPDNLESQAGAATSFNWPWDIILVSPELLGFRIEYGVPGTLVLSPELLSPELKPVAHAKYLSFQLAEVAVPRKLLARILERIARLCSACASG
jgi:hypothetical protein